MSSVKNKNTKQPAGTKCKLHIQHLPWMHAEIMPSIKFLIMTQPNSRNSTGDLHKKIKRRGTFFLFPHYWIKTTHYWEKDNTLTFLNEMTKRWQTCYCVPQKYITTTAIHFTAQDETTVTYCVPDTTAQFPEHIWQLPMVPPCAIFPPPLRVPNQTRHLQTRAHVHACHFCHQNSPNKFSQVYHVIKQIDWFKFTPPTPKHWGDGGGGGGGGETLIKTLTKASLKVCLYSPHVCTLATLFQNMVLADRKKEVFNYPKSNNKKLNKCIFLQNTGTFWTLPMHDPFWSFQLLPSIHRTQSGLLHEHIYSTGWPCKRLSFNLFCLFKQQLALRLIRWSILTNSDC